MLVDLSLRKAIKICGNQQNLLAEAIGEHPDKIRYWLNRSTSTTRIPFHNAVAIELATKGEVSRYDLAPYARFKNNRINDLVLSGIKPNVEISISDMVTIGVGYEKSLGNRNGKRYDFRPGSDITQVKGKTSALAAKHAGFSSRTIYLFAKKIVRQGVFKLVQAMDEKRISITNAVIISELPPAEQELILLKNNQELIDIVKELRIHKKKYQLNEIKKISQLSVKDFRMILLSPSLQILENESKLPLRLLLIGLSTNCYEKNIFEWHPEKLKELLIPHIEIDLSQVLECLESARFIIKIKSKNKFYGKIIFPCEVINAKVVT